MTPTLASQRTSRSSLWDDALKDLRRRVPEREFRTWIEPARWLGDADSEVRLLVPNSTFATHLEGRYEARLLEALRAAGSHAASVRCLVADLPSVVAGRGSGGRSTAVAEAPAGAATRSDALSPAYTFETFVSGAANQCARAAALAVSDPGAPGTPFTPLLIHGDVGVGKTHLLQAITWRLREGNRRPRVLYARGESFGRQVVNAVRTNALYAFREACQQLDALVVDDLQFVAGLARFGRSAEEFFHALTGLVERGRPVVISANAHPNDIENLDPRIRSRLESGLVTDMGPPEWKTRVDILRRRAKAREVSLPDGAAEKIASALEKSPRGLEGALSRVLALARTEGSQAVTMGIVDRVIEEAPAPAAPRVTVEEVIAAVATMFGVPPVRLIGSSRTLELALARHVAMYVARKVTGRTLVEMGASFRRNHSTVTYGIQRVEHQRHRDPGLDRLVQRLLRQFR